MISQIQTLDLYTFAYVEWFNNNYSSKFKNIFKSLYTIIFNIRWKKPNYFRLNYTNGSEL